MRFAASAILALTCFLRSDAATVVNRVVLVTGRNDLLLPAAAIANLDAPSRYVAGSSRWDHDGDGIVFNETHVAFLWSEAGGTQVASVSDDLYFEPNRHFPAAITSDGVMVGWDLFTEMFKTFPFVWARGAFQILPLPCRGQPLDTVRALRLSQCTGFATGVSEDGLVVVGTAQIGGGFFPPTQAVVWRADRRSRRPRYTVSALAAPAGSSNANAVSANGLIVAGDAGPDPFTLSAAHWVNGTFQPLEQVGSSSSALHLARDGSAAIGWAFLQTGETVLVRWDVAGAALVAAPPGGVSVVSINAINATATAAVGAVAGSNGNQAPYLWTLQGGYTILPELGRESDYDLSEALGVSADGRSVVGALQASVVSNGDPPSIGFLWTAGGGLVALDDLLAAAGHPQAGIFTAPAISSDGLRILATGDPPRTDHDTNSVVIELSP